jgi:hypothetical protein
VRNPHHGEPRVWRRHGHDPKELGAEVPRSGTCDVPLILPFQAPADIVRNTTVELRSIAT